MNYEIKPLVWKPYDKWHLYAKGVGCNYWIEADSDGESANWKDCSASYVYSDDIDDLEFHLAHGVNVDKAKGLCEKYHKKEVAKIIKDFVRTLR